MLFTLDFRRRFLLPAILSALACQAALVRAADDDLPEPLTPQQSLATIHVPDGLRVELVVAEPLVVDPIAMDWGADGRMWVVEMRDYPNGLDGRGKPGGRVRMLRDTDGDGRYDESTIFLDDLPFPTGVKAWRNGVLLTVAPEILYAEDQDGDGRADVRQVLYKGFVEGNQQHRVNGLRWGLDNWLYLANGDSGGRIQSTKTEQTVDIRGRDLRIRPDKGLLDAQSGQTQFGRDRDDWGNWFGGNNSNPLWHYVLADHYVRRNPHFAPTSLKHTTSVLPGAAPVYPLSRTLTRFNDFEKANRFTSACSPTIYRDTLLGDAYRGNVFLCEPVHNLVHRELVEPDGVTFRTRRADDELQSEFLASSDNWFRPTMVRAGPDGALWIADMYRLVIEHPEWIPAAWQQKLNLRAGDDRGRIYRVLPVGEDRPAVPPRLTELATPELVAALDNDTGWQRDTVQQLLVERDDRDAVAPLAAMVRDGKRPLARLHALCTLDGMGLGEMRLDGQEPLAVPTLLAALQDPHPGVRRHAVRVAEGLLEKQAQVTDRTSAADSPVVPAASQIKKHAQVTDRTSASDSPVIPAASQIERHAQVTDRLLQMGTDADPQVRLQLACSLGAIQDDSAAAVLAQLLLDNSDSPYLVAASLSSVHRDNLRGVLAGVLADSSPDKPAKPREVGDRRWAIVERLLGIAAGLGERQVVGQTLRAIAEPGDREPGLWQLTALAGMLDALARQSGSTTKSSIENTLDAETRDALRPLWKRARQLAGDEQADVTDRLVAVRVLARDSGASEPNGNEPVESLLRGLLQPQHPPELRLAAVDAIGQRGGDDAPAVLLADWTSHTPALRRQILDVLLSRDNWTADLLARLKDGRLRAAHLDARRRQQLAQHPREAIRRQAVELFAEVTQSARQEVLETYQRAITTEGDARRGQEVFAKKCAACHRLQGTGHDLGPDLTALTDKSATSLLIAIFDPNRAVEDRFLDYQAITTDGRQWSGMLVGESSNAIQLQGPDGKQQQILRGQIELLRTTGKSLMPEGMEKELSVEDTAGLIAYVRAVAEAPKQFEGNTPREAPIRDDGSIRLLAMHARIYGPSLVFESRYRNLGYWQHVRDRAEWSLRVPKAGEYRVVLDYACDDRAAGDSVRLEVLGQSLIAKVKGTGGWDTYGSLTLGTVKLPAGAVDVTIRSDGEIRDALLDLRGARLSPVK